PTGDTEGFRRVSFHNYRLVQQMEGLPPLPSQSAVAIIYVEGTLIRGGAADGSVAAEQVVSHLQAARRDSRVEAVVLRVNSPGGTLDAGEDVLREVERTNQSKPVVVSMGGLAASGG